MLSIGGVSSAGAASTYFAKDNYYTKAQGLGPSEWVGKGAEELGLTSEMSEAIEAIKSGKLSDHLEVPETSANSQIKSASEREVKAEDFKAVLNGFTNDGRVGRASKDGEWSHQPGKDLVFSPSKSVSIVALVGGDTRVVAAFQESVKETLEYAEKNYAGIHTNTKAGGDQFKKTGNIVAALFTHDTSRNQDPLLHVHAVVGNMTQDKENGSWKSLDMRPIYQNRFKLSEMQDSILASKLKALGYELEQSKNGHVEIKGVSKELRDAFSTRRAEIEDHMKEGANWNERQASTYATRDNKVELDRDKLTDVWRKTARRNGVDVDKLVEAAKSQTRGEGQGKAIAGRRLSMIAGDAVRSLTQNQITVSKAEIIAKVSKITQGYNVPIKRIEATLDKMEKKGGLIHHSTTASQEKVYTTANAQSNEKEILTRLNASKNNAPLSNNRSKVFERMTDVGLVQSQRETAVGIMTSRGRYIGVQGWAGTGKTYSVGKVAAALREGTKTFFNKDPQIYAFAPTKNAAAAIGEEVGAKAYTVQHFVASHTNIINGGHPTAKQINKYRGKITVFDESSMLDNKIMANVMKIADALEIKKVILVGDKEQHEGVQAGPAFRLMQREGMPTHAVTEIRRQAGPEGDARLLKAAEQAARGQFDKFFKTIDPDITQSTAYTKAAAQRYVDLRESGVSAEDVIVVSPDNRTRQAVSSNIREGFKESGRIAKQDHDHSVLRPTYMAPTDASYAKNYNKGEVLMFSQAIDKLGIKRGDTWNIASSNANTDSLVLRRGNKIIEWNLQRYHDRVPFEHMTKEQMKISVGDSIKFKNEDVKYKIEREQQAKITKIDKDTITMRHQDGRELQVRRGEKVAKIIDHAYTTTTYASQGLTKKHSIMVANSKTAALSETSIYIAMTRAKSDFKVFTDNKKEMIRQVMGNTGKDVHAIDAIASKSTKMPEKERAPIKVPVQDRAPVRVPARDTQRDFGR